MAEGQDITVTTQNENPFAALIEPLTEELSVERHLVEEIFLFTLRKSVNLNDLKSITNKNQQSLLLLNDVIAHNLHDGERLSTEVVAHALFERLMLTDAVNYLIPGINEEDTLQQCVFLYLHRSLVACIDSEKKYPHLLDDCKKLRELIFRNSSTIIQQPEFYEHQPISMSAQWLKLFENHYDMDTIVKEFMVESAILVGREEGNIEALGKLKAIYYPMLRDIQKSIAKMGLVSMEKRYFFYLDYFVSDKRAPQLGEVLMDFLTPNPWAKGQDFMDTILGQLLCLSILPKKSAGPYEFFQDSTLDGSHTDPNLWQIMANHQEMVYKLVKQLLLLGPVTKKKMLQWIAHCLHANISRGQIWSNINVAHDQYTSQNSSDSFMIGLCAVLLRLCGPLCEPQMKVLMVDPTYCAVREHDRHAKQVTMLQVTEETCLLPTAEDDELVTAEKYNFITELFYMTHKTIELGYRVCTERFGQMTRELRNLQTAYQDVANTDPNNDMAKNLFRMLKDMLHQFLCMRNGLMEPENDSYMLKFFEASAIWITEIALINETEYNEMVEKKDYTPQTMRNRPIPSRIDYIPTYLRSVPENIIENIVGYLSFSRYFSPGQLIEVYQSSHDAFFKLIILYMGNSKLFNNPHSRAKLAEALEFLLPKKITGSLRNSFISHVFDNHVDRLKVVSSLVNVFVSIEMTGQSVLFEQKFNYRRPMYAIIEYLWSREDHVQCFRDLAIEAEDNMEAIEPPLFLRFINLLINDAIYLLDESLSNLQQIRQLQEAQDKGEWESLPPNERQENLSRLQHLGMTSRFNNILGRETINIIKLLTTEIKTIFCHNSMVDRIAAMLNYFLFNLVGPQKEKFKVKDKKEFEFDPAQTVLEICFIYINLSCSDAFCLAISQDGRSYSSQLFEYAENILIRIGGGQLIGEMSEFAIKVKKLENEYKQEQEVIADAPDEYLDPIMSTLMTDPVILPTSNVTVDRTTIARHLLSDQTDPFNRAPLTMNKIKPNEKLKTEIDNWIAERRAAARIKTDN